MRTITVELPDVITVNGMTDAPESLRIIATQKWDAGFCLTAMIHGVSQKEGDTWSVSKKDEEKTKKVHDALEAGDWTTKARTGATAIKFENAIKALNIEALGKMLTKEQLFALAKLASPD